MERYYADIDGAEGPWQAEQLAELVRRGALGKDSKLVREGDTEWRPAIEVMPELFASSSAKGSAGRSWVRWASVGVASLLIGGLILGLVLWAPWESGGLVDEDFLRTALPSDVSLVRYSPRLSDHEGAEAMPDLDAASMAVFCNGQDIAGKLVGADGQNAGALAANGVFDLFEDEEVRQALQCGRGIAAKAEPGLLVIEAGDDDRTFIAWRGREANLIAARSHNFSGLDGQCLPSESDPASCASERGALIGHDGWWVISRATHLGGFARDWTREDRTETTNMEIVRELGAGMEPTMEGRIVVKPDQLGAQLSGACFRSAPSIALSGCFPDGITDSVQRIQSLTRGFGWQHQPMIDGEELRHDYLFLARDESDAESLLTELDALTRDWRAHLENREAQAVEDIREAGGGDADFREAQFRAFARAVKESETSADGALVRWEIATDLVESEGRAATLRREGLRTRYQAIERIIRAIEAGEDAERGDLVMVMGEEAADLVLMPRATAAQCEQIRARIAELEAAGVQPAEFGAKFRQTERFSTESCVGMPMPQSLLSCILEAQSFTAMEGCKGPTVGVGL